MFHRQLTMDADLRKTNSGIFAPLRDALEQEPDPAKALTEFVKSYLDTGTSRGNQA
jgi:hypothetical protein